MKAFIPSAGLGTRLRPFTLTNPKALVEVDGVPMLERVLLRLKSQGFDDIVINLHHFGEKIVDFVRAKDSFGIKIRFSDESDQLLDTGGGILKALGMLGETDEPFLIHNVDILSNADIAGLMKQHASSGADATLLVSERDSSRRLLWDEDMNLRGWHNLATDEYRPSIPAERDYYRELAFSGIHVMSPKSVHEEMRRQRRSGKFSIIDFYLSAIGERNIYGYEAEDLKLIDIGKPQTLAEAPHLLHEIESL
ncbi:MAG: NTP transferase domain-containing protein [Muribaculaceae bacterium]|nr:NTP transferase domain-containing protein [Muribaculaceae bacterium]MDE6558899.1 NTP transferase domain-containing protein [Muribaculaceae bacterium]